MESSKVEARGEPEKCGGKAVRLYKEGKYAEAISEFSLFLEEKRPKDADKKVAHYNRGMAYIKLGRFEEALKDGGKCIEMDPFWAKGYKCKCK